MPSSATKKKRVEVTCAEAKEILDVRAGFYKRAHSHPALNEPRSLEAAIAIVEEWRHRGPIPHAMKSTMELADALLCNDTNNRASIAVLAQALSNFVTGYTDSQQNLKRKISMFEVGRSIGLPATYIAMRHSIVHGEMPSLVELRRCALGALKWLWDEYWCHFDELRDSQLFDEASLPDSQGKTANEIGATETEDASLIEKTLQRYGDRTALPKDKPDGSRRDHVAAATASCNAVKKLGLLCDKNESNVEALAALLLQEGRVLPGPQTKRSAEDIIYQWWPLIEGQSKRNPAFVEKLMINLAGLLALSSKGESDRLPYTQAIAIKAWFGFILKQGKYGKGLEKLPVKSIIHICLASPGPYTTSIALEIFESEYYDGCAYEKEALQMLQALVGGSQPENKPEVYSDLQEAVSQADEEIITNMEASYMDFTRKRVPLLAACPRPIGKESVE